MTDKYANAFYRHKETKILIKIIDIIEKEDLIKYKLIQQKGEGQCSKEIFLQNFKFVENGTRPPMHFNDEGLPSWPTLERSPGKRVETNLDGTPKNPAAFV